LFPTEKIIEMISTEHQENQDIQADFLMMKNLFFRLNFVEAITKKIIN
jgi:hypothetical protein